MLNNISLSDLPSYGKLFVGLFTSLMLCICFWAMLILYVEKGLVDKDYQFSFFTESSDKEYPVEIQKDIDEILEDSLSVLAPIWNSEHTGSEEVVDSVTMVKNFRERYLEQITKEKEIEAEEKNDRKRFRKNLGLAHTHINGQTLLFFAMGLVFLFTSVKVKIKKITLWVFAVAIFTHAIGLAGSTYNWFYDDILALSGAVILVSIFYMAFMIFMDLGKAAQRLR
ncbi:MAG: hypothetical protein ACE5D6_04695 [Candidatus Zixiibacteriota bacterium]